MYKKYFGFNESPFSIAPNPRYLYMSEMHQEALAHLKYGSISDGCIILLTGEIGTGKTTICRCFLDMKDSMTDAAIIINPKLTANELLGAICDEFEISPKEPEPTVKNHIDCLNDYLLKGHAGNRQALLFIDEAQNLELDVLEMLRLLTNLETNRQKLLKIFLLGQSELLSILSRPDLTQINQRITSRYHLKGLKRNDVEAYIDHRVTVAGGGRGRLFSKSAVKRIYAISGGIPRLINSLCDRCLLGAFTEGKDQVSEKIVKKAALEIFGRPEKEKKSGSRFVLMWSGVIFLACLLLAFWYRSYETPAADPIPEEQTSRTVNGQPPDPAENPTEAAQKTADEPVLDLEPVSGQPLDQVDPLENVVEEAPQTTDEAVPDPETVAGQPLDQVDPLENAAEETPQTTDEAVPDPETVAEQPLDQVDPVENVAEETPQTEDKDIPVIRPLGKGKKYR